MESWMRLERAWLRRLTARTDLAKHDCYFLTGVSRGLGLRERSKRDSSTSQADSFADERGEKASACFGRNDRWEQVLAMSASPSQRAKPTDWRLRNSDREVIEHRGKLDLV